LVKIKSELVKLGPLIDLEALREPQGSKTEGGLTVESRTIEHGWLAFKGLSPAGLSLA
jgi:hypothetical protein